MSAVHSLPDLDTLDHAALKALLLSQQEKYTATLTSRTSEIERLVLLVEKLQRMLFGTKSEKVLRQIEQLELQLQELQAASAIEEHAAAASVARPIAAKPFRRPLPEHLAHASPTTTEAIERIAALYAIEAEIRGSTPEVR